MIIGINYKTIVMLLYRLWLDTLNIITNHFNYLNPHRGIHTQSHRIM